METPPQPNGKKRQEVGPILAIVIVVALLLLGGVYFLITQEMRLHQSSGEGVNS